MTTVQVQAVTNTPYKQQITVGNHTFTADVTPEKGGQDTAPDPHQYLLAALGACTNMTLQMYASRKGWDLKGVSVELSEGKSADGRTPKIEKNISVQGNLTDDQVKRLKSIAEACPVNKIITGSPEMASQLNLLG